MESLDGGQTWSKVNERRIKAPPLEYPTHLQGLVPASLLKFKNGGFCKLLTDRQPAFVIRRPVDLHVQLLEYCRFVNVVLCMQAVQRVTL